MKDDKLYLIHIKECIERIEAYTIDGKDFFADDTKTQQLSQLWDGKKENACIYKNIQT